MLKIKEIIIGADHAGFKLKEKLKNYLEKKGLAVTDVGTYSQESCDYPEFAYRVAKLIVSKNHKRGILICKTGIGSSIAANKLDGIRAALCYNLSAAKLSREHNDSNILVLGAAFVDEKLAKRITGVWLGAKFQGGRHKRRLNKIKIIERG